MPFKASQRFPDATFICKPFAEYSTWKDSIRTTKLKILILIVLLGNIIKQCCTNILGFEINFREVILSLNKYCIHMITKRFIPKSTLW